MSKELDTFAREQAVEAIRRLNMVLGAVKSLIGIYGADYTLNQIQTEASETVCSLKSKFNL